MIGALRKAATAGFAITLAAVAAQTPIVNLTGGKLAKTGTAGNSRVFIPTPT